MHPTLLTAATEALDAFRAFRTALNHEQQRDAEELLESAMERLGEAVRREEQELHVTV